jgi:hemerythrin
MLSAWNPSLATKVVLVDNEHQEIFRQAAMLNQAMIDGKGRQELKKLVDFIDDYIVTHFSHEEKVMDQYQCSVAEVNKQAHSRFIAKFKELKAKFDGQGANTSLVLDISTMINNWLIEHIKQIDSQLSNCTKKTTKQSVKA